jgi:hypothetical protein
MLPEEEATMPRLSTSGQCAFCKETFPKAAMTRHLKSCGVSQPANGRPVPARSKRYFHLIVEGRHDPAYWMHLAVDAEATLAGLDRFLRRTWLECCGHMSAFTIGGKRYSVAPMIDLDEDSMEVALDAVLMPRMKFFHEYDYGSTTELALRVAGDWEGKTSKSAVAPLARNLPPAIYCGVCGSPTLATQICAECQWNGEGWLCGECAAEHECGQDMQLPVVNSPRTGVCGYTG